MTSGFVISLADTSTLRPPSLDRMNQCFYFLILTDYILSVKYKQKSLELMLTIFQ